VCAPATFRDRNFAVVTALARIIGCRTDRWYCSHRLQDLQGYPEALIGYLIASRGLGNRLLPDCGAAHRLSPRLCLALGLSFQAVAGLGMGSFDINLTSNDVM
jgi:hypothetical protein